VSSVGSKYTTTQERTMGIKVRRLLKHLFTLPWSREGRRMRIERLMELIGEERDICAAIIYGRDFAKGFRPSEWEYNDFKRICQRVEKGEIIMPADRG